MAVKTSIRVSINKAAVVRVVGPMGDQSAYRAAQRVRSRAVTNINRLGRVDTGLMKNSIRVRRSPVTSGMNKAYQVSASAPYTRYQEYGTRAHGPVRAKRLVFRIRGSGPLIFARMVRGVTPGRFMRDAMNATTVRDFTLAA